MAQPWREQQSAERIPSGVLAWLRLRASAPSAFPGMYLASS